jgi:hypothetical protein
MAKFEQMVKMMTDEPKVSLVKLKKGGGVKSKMAMGSGHQPMSMPKMYSGPADGKAPKRPPMAARMKAMNPNQYAKGGEVQGKQMGGRPMTGGGFPMPAMPTQPMGRAALMGMAPDARNARAMAVRKAITGLKKGGPANQGQCDKLEKELRHHESLSADKAHGHAKGGSINEKGAKPSGEKIGSFQARSAVGKGSDGVKPFVNRADTSKVDRSPASTGKIKKANAGGYKDGGSTDGDKTPSIVNRSYAKGGRATGSSIPSVTGESETRGAIKMGGTVEDNERYYENTEVHSARPNKGSKATGDVKMANAGGYNRGGKVAMMKGAKEEGGDISKFVTRNAVKGGDWENLPADTTKPGVSGTNTGKVRLGNAGGYKDGGNAGKKRYATGGEVNTMGIAKKMPARIHNPPVANTKQSGTYKKGGKV